MEIERQIDTETRIFDLAELFKVFGDSTRIRILYELFEEPELNVTDIADRISMTSSAVSHQLKTLRVSNLIKSRKEGKTVYYSLADDHVKTILFIIFGKDTTSNLLDWLWRNCHSSLKDIEAH